MLAEHLKLYRSLNKNRVRYFVIGGIACGIYGSPRVTVDVDIAIEPTLENTTKLHRALIEAGFGTAYLTTPEKILANEISIFDDYIKLDVITKPRGLDFKKAWPRKSIRDIKGVRVKFISLDDLIESKVASHRRIDMEDIKILRKIKKRLKKRVK